MVIVAFVTTKGGSGKSCASSCIAVAACQAGLRVLLLDVDPQLSCASWADRRPQQSQLVVVAAKLADVPRLLIRAETLGYDCVIIDSAGHDLRALVAIARVASLNILVTRPTRADVEVAMAVRALIARPYAILLTQTPHTLNARLLSWRKAAAALGTVVDATLAYRIDYQDAFAAGRGVTEWAPSSLAANEVRTAFRWIWQKVTETGDVHQAQSA